MSDKRRTHLDDSRPKCKCHGRRMHKSGFNYAGKRQWKCAVKNRAYVNDLYAQDNGTYSSWRGMRKRCDDPANDSYPRYGGRGITYVERWKDYETFLEDMGPRPDDHDIDRIDSDGDYTPDNCRWLPSGINRSQGGRTRARQMADQMIDRMEAELNEARVELEKEGVRVE